MSGSSDSIFTMADKLSYISTPMVGNYMYETLPDRLRCLATEDGDREAFVYFDHNWTREAISRRCLLERTLSLARVLVKDGLKKGAPVGFCMRNSINMLVSNFAVVCAGGIPFYMGTNLKDGSDVIETLRKMDCELFIIDASTGDDNWRILEAIWPLSASGPTVTTLKTVICNGDIGNDVPNRTQLRTLLDREEVDVTLPEIQPEDILAQFCTSGSTGKPKDVFYTHYSMFNWVNQSNHLIKLKPDSRFFLDRTFSWAGGYPKEFLVNGSTRVFVDPQLTLLGGDTDKLAEVIYSETCDVVVLPGYLAVDLLSRPYLSKLFRKVEAVVLTGERAPVSYARLRGSFCKELCVFYGATETGGSCVFRGSSVEEFADGIIGTPVGGTEIKIIDESGAVVPRGEQGELCIRSTSVFSSYRNDTAQTRQALDESHWFHSGDMAHIRPDGNIVIDGRNKEMVSMQTSKFFPWSVEKVLNQMPGKHRAFAVGVPDVRFNQVFCACVVPNDEVVMTSDDVKKYCDDAFLAESTTFGVTTKPVYHIVLDTVPLLSSGKVNRMKIADIAKDRLNLN